jgi:DNA-binding response OmpR family regulator
MKRACVLLKRVLSHEGQRLKMSEFTATESPAHEDERPVPRRAFLVADDALSADALRDHLAAIGFEVALVPTEEAARRAEESAPSVVLIACGSREDEGKLVTLARRLRAEASTFALPLVFLFRADGRTLRSAAQHIGADDYFAQDASRDELRARLEALFWRVEAGRRAAPAVAEQRSEIDNFIFLLDAVAADAGRSMKGALALVEARGNGDGVKAVMAANCRERPLAAAHGFLKLNLRRVDAVAFYGPATLLVYLPGVDSPAARSTLSRLREQFSETHPDGDLVVGLSSFPADGMEVEKLVEQAGVALDHARASNSHARVFVYGVEGVQSASSFEAELRTLSETSQRKMTATRAAKTEVQAVDMSVTESLVAALQHSSERPAGGKVRRLMLIVSDAARMTQVNLLMRSSGYEVRAAFDGQHALNLLRIDRPDLLLVDYELHGMDGIEMLRRLGKQSGAGQFPPALLLAPAGREDLRREALEAGARSVVALPYDPVELLDTLRDFGKTE